MLHVPSDHIWRPDIVLYNKYSTLFFPSSTMYHVVFLLPIHTLFQRVSDTNTSKKPDTLVVTHLFFHVKQKKTCTKLVPEKCCHQFRTYLLRIREGNKGRRKTRLKLFSETRQKLQFPPKKLLYSFNPN